MNIEKVFFQTKSINDKNLPRYWYGGTKGLETSILIGAYNYIEIKALINYMIKMKWEYIEGVQILYKEQLDDNFNLIKQDGGSE